MVHVLSCGQGNVFLNHLWFWKLEFGNMPWEWAGQYIAVMLEYNLALVRQCGSVFSLGTAVEISDFACNDVLA